MMKLRMIAAGAFMLVGVGGCSSDKPSSRPPDLTIRMSEWLWEPSTTSVKAGDVVIEANNVGGAEHEVIVVAGSDPKAFATKADGSIDEEAIDEAAKMGEIEHVATNSVKEGTFSLKPGTYVIMCNLVDANGVAHYTKGMVSTLTVT
jgi:plastocyanin